MDTGCLHSFADNNTVTGFTYTPDQERLFLLDLFNATCGPSFWVNKTALYIIVIGLESSAATTVLTLNLLASLQTGFMAAPPNFSGILLYKLQVEILLFIQK